MVIGITAAVWACAIIYYVVRQGGFLGTGADALASGQKFGEIFGGTDSLRQLRSQQRQDMLSNEWRRKHMQTMTEQRNDMSRLQTQHDKYMKQVARYPQENGDDLRGGTDVDNDQRDQRDQRDQPDQPEFY